MDRIVTKYLDLCYLCQSKMICDRRVHVLWCLLFEIHRHPYRPLCRYPLLIVSSSGLPGRVYMPGSASTTSQFRISS